SFFFQAEDGIRDYKVTGVQTCALPIYFLNAREGRCAPEQRGRDRLWRHRTDIARQWRGYRPSPRCSLLRIRKFQIQSAGFERRRSEERRVGKECRTRELAAL